jgi:hypothetical protein
MKIMYFEKDENRIKWGYYRISPPTRPVRIGLVRATEDTEEISVYGESAAGSEASGSERRYRFSISSFDFKAKISS